MPRKILILFLLPAVFVSCDQRKKYIYLETVEATQLFGGTDIEQKDSTEILAWTDTAAYIEAYRKYCISQKVSEDMKRSLGSAPSTPLRFSLYNEKGEDIANLVSFASKQAQEEEIKTRIFAMENSFEEAKKNEAKTSASAAPVKMIDSAKVAALEKNFRVKKDEFSNEDKKWYEPRTAPKYTNANGIYCYFQTEHGRASNFRFRIQYYADDWLFFKKVQFAIDDKAYEYIPLNTETDNGDGGYIWEWFDEQVSRGDKELINALANAKSAKMKFIGRQYHNVKNISQTQLKSIKEALELYQALGGEW